MNDFGRHQLPEVVFPFILGVAERSVSSRSDPAVSLSIGLDRSSHRPRCPELLVSMRRPGAYLAPRDRPPYGHDTGSLAPRDLIPRLQQRPRIRMSTLQRV